MRLIFCALLFTLFTVQGADSDLAGTFTGQWKSNGESGGGAYSITLKPVAGGTWTADVSFNVAGEDIKAAVKEVKVTGTKLDIAYDFETQGTGLKGTATGELKGAVLAGTYQSLIPGGAAVDEGTWTATRTK